MRTMRAVRRMPQEELVEYLSARKEAIPEDNFKALTLDILSKATSYELSPKQRNVLNICYSKNFELLEVFEVAEEDLKKDGENEELNYASDDIAF